MKTEKEVIEFNKRVANYSYPYTDDERKEIDDFLDNCSPENKLQLKQLGWAIPNINNETIDKAINELDQPIPGF